MLLPWSWPWLLSWNWLKADPFRAGEGLGGFGGSAGLLLLEGNVSFELLGAFDIPALDWIGDIPSDTYNAYMRDDYLRQRLFCNGSQQSPKLSAKCIMQRLNATQFRHGKLYTLLTHYWTKLQTLYLIPQLTVKVATSSEEFTGRRTLGFFIQNIRGHVLTISCCAHTWGSDNHRDCSLACN